MLVAVDYSKKFWGCSPVTFHPLAPRFSWKRICVLWRWVVGRMSIKFRFHVDVNHGGTLVFVGRCLQKLVAEFDAVMKAEKGRHLVAKLGVILHPIGIEDIQNLVEVVGFDSALEIG